MSSRELLLLAMVGLAALAIATIGWSARAQRRRSASSGASTFSGTLGVVDQIFQPQAAHASEIREVERWLQSDAPVAGDDIEPGKTLTIDLTGGLNSRATTPKTPKGARP